VARMIAELGRPAPSGGRRREPERPELVDAARVDTASAVPRVGMTMNGCPCRRDDRMTSRRLRAREVPGAGLLVGTERRG
jgi:hypothetical protein